jgi:hypothetical protein
MELAEPWKGKQWGDGDNVFGGLKLLVLGESAFYAGAVGTSPQDMITGAVSAYLAQHRDQYGLFYPKITTLLPAKTPTGSSMNMRREQSGIPSYFGTMFRLRWQNILE